MDELLAKSSRRGQGVGLDQHALDTEAAAIALFSPGSRLSGSWCTFFGMDEPDAFLRNLRAACLLHDLGKANTAFQAAIRSGTSQPVRHEHLSALILCLPELRTWLGGTDRLDFDAVGGAVLSHHLKATRSDGRWPWGLVTGNPRVHVPLGHPQIRALLDRVAATAGLAPAPWVDPGPWPGPRWEAAWSWGVDHVDELDLVAPEVGRMDPTRNFRLAVKAGLIAADALGSAVRREGLALEAFLGDSLHRPALTREQILNEIVGPRVADLQRKGRPFIWDPFQLASDHLPDLAAIVAPCGAGKTLAAWRWAASVAGRKPIGSVIFLYPTRATATEGFKDYVAWAPEGRLLTGTSRLDLQGLLRNPPESMVGKTYPDDEEDRLFALGNWRIPFFSATLDQFLSFLEHGYGGLCRLPQLADSAVILDEAHSLDNRLFERLCALLLHFRLPVLLLSASLPRERIRKLQDLGVRVFPEGREREAYPSLLAEEERPRYRMARREGVASALQTVLASEQEAARSTLWVVNTVRRCQELAFRLKALGIDPLVYHSRFTLRDRRRQHRAVVQAFQNPGVTMPWAVTTQICEMSLDLDADRLVTEDVPLPSLIQRMGRSNRSRSRNTSFRAEVISYPPGDGRPYDLEPGGPAAVAGMRRFAVANDGRELGQGDLTRSLQNPRFAPDAPLPTAWASFLCETWFASTEPLRGEEGDLDTRCILTTDLEHGLGPQGMPGDPDRDPLEAWILSVPRRFVLKDQPLPEWLEAKGLGLADGARYRPDLGFLLFDPE